MKKIVLTLAATLLLCLPIYAQPGGIGGISYSTAQTMWETRDFIQDYSWRGLAVEYKHMTSEVFSYGFQFGWNNFGQRVDDVIELDNGAISGTQIRKLGVIPILVSLNYHAGSLYSEASPYLTLNVGAFYMREQYQFGVFVSDRSAWHFALAPEIGVYIPVSDAYLQLALKLNHAFAAGDYFGGGSKEFSYLTLNIGVAFPTF